MARVAAWLRSPDYHLLSVDVPKTSVPVISEFCSDGSPHRFRDVHSHCLLSLLGCFHSLRQSRILIFDYSKSQISSPAEVKGAEENYVVNGVLTAVSLLNISKVFHRLTTGKEDQLVASST
ncbi:hypothetical protein RJ641_003210 [Dillenia turbinata]|uniref:Uncharacterized protein n=1 Tax=Dillenia turbinata TaxID=194707 RepID=A0AAN8VL23_9MAGN